MDKVFVPFKNIVDFGCANGELIKILQLLFGEHNYIGYDISKDMLEKARKNVVNADFYCDWDKIKVDFEDSLINISSTLHEVYSYGTAEDVEIFWKRNFKSNFKYIAIRDMMLSDNDKLILDEAQYDAIKNDKIYADKLNDYEAVWGKISTQYDLTHYLLKYKYTENWDREVRENYVPITVESLLKLIPDDYEVNYLSHFTLPYTAWQIKNDFNVDLKTQTHIKIILKRK